MSAEVICVGTELLLGEILNTNVQYLAQELASLGIPHYHQNVVGDNPERIKQVMEIAINRGASILIFTGGLGPTPDDLTTKTIAEYFKTPLVENQEVIADIEQKFAHRGQRMTANNRQQALLPAGCQVLPNSTGTAPGMIWHPQPNLLILTFPGVPSEMTSMWKTTAVPYLKKLGWGQEVIYSHTLRFRGISESALAVKVERFFDLTNPTVAPYASRGEVRLRISAKAPSQNEAQKIIEPIAKEIQKIAGLDYFGANEDTLALIIGSILQRAKETLSVAESCTGGGLGEMITTTPGSSVYFKGGVIAYSNQVKVNLLGVNLATLEQYGAVSPQVALEMAKGISQKLDTTWAISVTGIAGPDGGTPTKPVGLVYIGIAGPNGILNSFELKLGNKRDRSSIRYLSSCYALDNFRRQLMIRNKL